MISESKSGEYSQEVALSGDRGFEYRSDNELFGLPLIHITRGVDPVTGRRRVSKGIIAIGEAAIGLIAVGGFALGGIAIGGLGIGLIAIGGLALGVIAIGAVSFGLSFAVGTVALSLTYAIGWSALAPHFIDVNGISESFYEMISGWLWSIVNYLAPTSNIPWPDAGDEPLFNDAAHLRSGRNLWITIIAHGLPNTLSFSLIYAGML